jgi:hypothetical protein
VGIQVLLRCVCKGVPLFICKYWCVLVDSKYSLEKKGLKSTPSLKMSPGEQDSKNLESR